MIPGINPRDMARAMKKMGIKQTEIKAQEVIIKCPDKDIIITEPQVAKVNMMGQETWQITGKAQEQEKNTEPEIKEEDIETVIQQTNATKEEALEAIKKAKGDLAQAILDLSQNTPPKN
ncbi:nascent polypeptide-associated complex protein [Candidatus Woesearchaeota archaeon]|nr:MAG: nascent polypeptide-associated complex protein [Candidatus Woesearchaeota archaeon ex4484_78]RLE46039.1 MAG: nascent polypeptide-associated complex protein [Candidatus Woesearchaeota archaeon]